MYVVGKRRDGDAKPVTIQLQKSDGTITWSADWGSDTDLAVGYFVQVEAILTDEWGGGDFIAVNAYHTAADTTTYPKVLEVIKVDVEGTDGYTWAGFRIDWADTGGNYGDPVSYYLVKEEMFYLAFSLRSVTSIIRYKTSDETIGSIYQIATPTG